VTPCSSLEISCRQVSDGQTDGRTDGRTDKKMTPPIGIFFFFFFFLIFCTITYASRQVFLYLFHKYDAKLGDSNADLFFITEFNMNLIRIELELN
jgi:hypothetical protein